MVAVHQAGVREARSEGGAAVYGDGAASGLLQLGHLVELRSAVAGQAGSSAARVVDTTYLGIALYRANSSIVGQNGANSS